jgi:hypothetical protein
MYTNEFMTADEREVIKNLFYRRGIKNPHVGLKQFEDVAEKNPAFREVWQSVLGDKGNDRTKAAATVLASLRNISKSEKVRAAPEVDDAPKSQAKKSRPEEPPIVGLLPSERLKIREIFYTPGQPIKINQGICQDLIEKNFKECADILNGLVARKGSWQKALVAMRGTCKAAEKTDREDAARK